MEGTCPTHPALNVPPDGLTLKHHPGDASLDLFFTTRKASDLPSTEKLDQIFDRCSLFVCCTKCMTPGSLARKNTGKTLRCTTNDCYQNFPREMLPAAYGLGLTMIPPITEITNTENPQQNTMMTMINTLAEQVANLTKVIAELQHGSKGTVNAPIEICAPPNASLISSNTTLYSQAHIERPTHSIAWSKIAANCPEHLKSSLDEMKKETLQRDRVHRRDRKKNYSGELVRVFVDGIPRFQATMDQKPGALPGTVLRTRLQRTQDFLQMMRIQMTRVHSFFPRGYKSFEFLIEKDYENTFKSHLRDNACRINPRYNPDAPRNVEEATDEQKAAQIRISLDHYIRECSRATATPAAKDFYRKKGIALVGEREFDISLMSWSPYRRNSTEIAQNSNTQNLTGTRRPRSPSNTPERGNQRQNTTQSIQATTQSAEVEMIHS